LKLRQKLGNVAQLLPQFPGGPVSLAPGWCWSNRETELQELAGRHGTPQQAAFFLERRGRSLTRARRGSVAQGTALDRVAAAIPQDWRRGDVERADLARFVFGPEDIVIAVGQDGLVANVAKYLDGQPVIGINPDPDRNPGVLVRHPPEAVADLLSATGRGRAGTEARSMVEVATDDGQSLVALNEIYLGHPTHQSARYTVQAPGGRRRAAVVVGDPGRHRHGLDRLVPLGVARAPQPAHVARADRPHALLVRPGGVAVAVDRHRAHRGDLRRRRAARRDRGVRPGGVRRRDRDRLRPGDVGPERDAAGRGPPAPPRRLAHGQPDGPLVQAGG
jgi:hypothetical protein